MATHLIIFFRTKQVHTFTIFFTKNSNSEKKILHARHQNLLRAENRKKNNSKTAVLAGKLQERISPSSEGVGSADFGG